VRERKRENVLNVRLMGAPMWPFRSKHGSRTAEQLVRAQPHSPPYNREEENEYVFNVPSSVSGRSLYERKVGVRNHLRSNIV